jgi:hypothetical protein
MDSYSNVYAALTRSVGILLTSSFRRHSTYRMRPACVPKKFTQPNCYGGRYRFAFPQNTYRCWREMPRSCAISAFCSARRPADAHHLRFAQAPALGRKVSDELTVPLCRGHHREVHRCGDEAGLVEDVRHRPDHHRSVAAAKDAPRFNGPIASLLAALGTTNPK